MMSKPPRPHSQSPEGRSTRHQRGATLIEYVLIAGIVIVGVVLSQAIVLTGMQRFYGTSGGSLDYTQKHRLIGP